MTQSNRITTIIFTSIVAGTSAVYGQVDAGQPARVASPSESGANTVAETNRPAPASPARGPVVAPVEDEPANDDAADSELARRMRDALTGKSKTHKPQVRRPAKPSHEKVWSCSGWEELWQGRGKARSCEWR